MKPILTLLIAFLFAVNVYAGKASFRHYSTDNGLPSNTVRDIIQDSTGFMWIGTDGGLTRFDGRKFKVFCPIDSTGKEIKDVFVGKIVEIDNKLWILSDNCILCFDPVTEAMTGVEPKYKSDAKRRINGTIRDICVDADKNLWVACNGNGVFQMDTRTHETTHYDVPELSNNPGTIFVDSRNDVWLVNNNGSGALMKLDKNRNVFRPFAITVNGEPAKIHSLVIAEDNSRHMWIGLWDSGLLRFDPYTGQGTKVLNPSQCDGLLRIHSVRPLDDNTLMIGSDAGLTVFNPSTGGVTRMMPNELDRTSLSDRFVYPIVVDNEGGKWIGTFYGGVNYMPPELKQFDSFRHSQFVNSVSGDIISGFCEDHQGNIWIASDDGGLSCMSPSGVFTHHTLQDNLPGGSAENVHCIAADGDKLWIGTYSSGVWTYDPRTRIARRFPSSHDIEGALDDNSSYAIYRDSRGNVWVATMRSIFLYDRKHDNFEKIRAIDVLTDDIDQDSDGNLWFSTQGKGLFRLDPFHSVWKNYRVDDSNNSLPSNFVNCVLIDSSGRIWAGTGRGLALFNASTDTFEPVDLGHYSGNIFWIGESENSLWMTTSEGILNYGLSTGELASYTVDDGLLSSQFSPNAGIRATNGRIYVGSVRGFNSFYPRQISPNTKVPTVVFTDLDVVNRHVPVGDQRLPRSINHIDRLELSHDDYLFTVEFAALSYANPDQNQYSYMLEGFDKNWIETGGDNRAPYTNLQPGNYTLKVKASNNDKLWTDTLLELPIHVSPPWYASWPMKLLYTLLLICAIAAGFWVMRIYYERRQNEELMKVSAATERRVFQAKLSFFTMIAHEIRTPVSLIIGPLEQIIRHPGNLSASQSADLDVINRNSRRLLSLVDQLLDFKKVEQEGLQISPRQIDLNAMLKSIGERFSPSFKHQNITFEVNLPEQDVVALVDQESMTKMVSNLLSNARKFAVSKVSLTMTEQPDDNTVTITVADDGCGIPADSVDKIFNPFYQVDSPEHKNHGGTGIGLSIVKTAVEAHKGTIRIDSCPPRRGTAFIVTLPIGEIDTTAETVPSLTDATAEDTKETETPKPASDRRPTMLVVDDNPDMLRFIQSNFNNTYRVICAPDGTKALEMLKAQPVDFIISDWMMPGLSGVDLCKEVRRDPALSHIPFILLTAKTDDYSKIRGLNCGADAYVAKPFSVAILEARINGLLNIRDLLRKKFSNTPMEPITSVASNPTDSEFLDRLTAEIEANFANPELSVDKIAESIGMSRSSLYAKIKSLLDVTPNELIQITRLKKAASLLAEGRYRVNEVSYMIGFNSSSYFTKCFQKQFGIKPTDFASKNQNQEGK